MVLNLLTDCTFQAYLIKNLSLSRPFNALIVGYTFCSVQTMITACRTSEYVIDHNAQTGSVTVLQETSTRLLRHCHCPRHFRSCPPHCCTRRSSRLGYVFLTFLRLSPSPRFFLRLRPLSAVTESCATSSTLLPTITGGSKLAQFRQMLANFAGLPDDAIGVNVNVATLNLMPERTLNRPTPVRNFLFLTVSSNDVC